MAKVNHQQPTAEMREKMLAQDARLGAFPGFTERQIGLESGFDPEALSRKNAMGYAQVIPTTLAGVERDLGRKLNPKDFDDALAIHGHVMKQNLRRFGNLEDATRAYNAGWTPAGWDNPETNNYHAVIFKDRPATAAAPATTPAAPVAPDVVQEPSVLAAAAKPAGPSKVAEQLALSERMAPELGQMAQRQSARDVGPRLFTDPDMTFPDAAEQQGFAAAAAASHEASMREAFSMAFDDNLTGLILDAVRGPAPTFNWKASEEQLAEFRTEMAYGNNDLRDYVFGATSDEDFRHRRDNARDRAEFMERAANVTGADAWGTGVAAFAGGMADPAMIVGTLGLGVGLNTARAAAQTGRAMMMAKTAAAGAAENMVFEAGLRASRNQKITAQDLLQQGLFGAVIGAAAGSLHFPGKAGVADTEINPAVRGAEATLAERTQAGLDNPAPAGLSAGDMRALPGAALDDVPAHNPVQRLDGGTAEGAAAVPRAKAGDAATEGLALHRVSAASAESWETPSADYDFAASNLGYRPEPTIGDAHYAALHKSGVVMELREPGDLAKASRFHASYGDGVPADAKALYSPQDDRVYVFTKNLTDAERADASGLIMHEVGVHYGLERSIGTERFTQVLDSLDRSTDPKVQAAMARVPSDTPAHLRMEETLGYLVEKHPDLPVVAKLLSSIRNWLRENVSAFRNLEVTTADAIAYVRGSVEKVRREGKLSADETFPYVWHGSPVKGIEKFDLSFSGTGEGNAAFGWGHYMTSEKGTALDYRNKESLRRGMTADEGGLYRLRVNTTRDRLMSWEQPVGEQATVGALVKGLPGITPEMTGEQAYRALATRLGSQQAASEALHELGVHGLAYATGRSRGSDKVNSNYVFFSDDAVDIVNRYSRGEAPTAPAAGVAPKVDLAQNEASRKWSQAIDDHIEVRGEASERAEAYYDSAIRNKLLDKTGVGQLLDSVGLTLARSESKGVRMVASMLAEDPSGLNRQHAASAALDAERLKHGFRAGFVDVYHSVVPKMLSGKELVMYRMGMARDAEKRIGRQVAEYRLAKRSARMAGAEFDATRYDPNVVTLGNHLDGFWGNIVEASKAAGEEHGTAIGGKGFQGHMPYRWDWANIHRTFTDDPEKFKSLKVLFRNEYNAKVIDPAVTDAIGKAASPEEIIALRTQLGAKVDHLVDNYLQQVMRDPKSRIQHQDNFVADVSQQVLADEFRGQKITNEVIDAFKRRVEDIKNDRTRTEFDLLRQHNGVSMLDFIDADIGRMVDTNAQRFAGNISLARRGLGDVSAVDAMKDALRRDGAAPQDLDNIDFLIRSLNGQLNPDEAGAAKIMSQGAYASMMGKLGFNALADASGTITAVGVGGMLRALGKGFSKDNGLMESLRKFAPGVLVHDARLFSQTPEGAANPATIFSEGSHLANGMQSATEAVSRLSGLHHVSKFLHNGFVPVFAEDLIKTIRSGEGMSAARLGDLGLTPERIAKIKHQLDTHDAARAEGEAINWAAWDQGTADDLVAAVQRGTGQALQRAYVGETPRWVTETTVGRMVAQFRRFGFLASEKQTVRNLAIGDSNAYSAFAVGAAMGAALYYAKLQANTTGMTAAQADEYIEKNFSGAKGLQGILVMMNMSGMAADAADLTALLLGGRSHGTSAAVASLGYLQNLTGGVSALTSSAFGAFAGDEVDYQKKMREAFRMVPGSNTMFGTALSNALNAE